MAGPVVVGVGGSSLGLTRAGQEECVVPGRLAPLAGQLSEQRDPVPATSKLSYTKCIKLTHFVIVFLTLHRP